MKRFASLPCIAALLAVAVAGPARADSGFALRWFRVPEKTSSSGKQQAPYAADAIVRITPTMTDTNDADQIFAVQGIELRQNGWNDACGIRLVPAYLDPARSSRVTGVRVWGARIDSTARLAPLMENVSFELPSCKAWEDRVNCPDGQIATSVSVRATASIQTMTLRCAKVYERAKTPPDQKVTVGEPSWAATMSVPLTIENTGQLPIGYRGITLRVRAKSRTCEQAFPNEAASALNLDEKRSLHLSLACARDDVVASCDGGRCQVTIEWTLSMTAPTTKTASGSQVVTFPKPSTATGVARR